MSGFFSVNGFGNPLAFQTIDDSDISAVEIFMRTYSSEFESFHMDPNKKDNGEMFAANPEQFKFRPGDIRMIRELVRHVKKVIDGSGAAEGLAHFTTKNKVNEIQSIADPQSYNECKTQTHYFLNKLLSAADRNSHRKKGGYRYDDDIKLFAAYLRTIVGPYAYETIQKNLVHSLPSLPSTNRYVRSSGCNITESILRCDELAIYLAEKSLEPVVVISTDATRISGRVQYDSKSNQCVGFVPPLKNGMPVPFSFPARNAEEISCHFLTNKPVASFLNVIMAQPIANIPPFCLMVYSSDNRYTAHDVASQWQYITGELEKVGIKVLAISSDSDPKYNAAMRALSGIGYKTSNQSFSCRLDSGGPFYFQDMVHIATKMRNFLLRSTCDKKILPFGNGLIRVEHLYQLLNLFMKDKHQLTYSTLNPTDKQNFKSVLRICSSKVTDLLRDHVKNSQGTIQFLQIMRDIIDSFMEINLTPLQRVRKIWYALFLIRIWRKFILSSKCYTLEKNFLSLNCYTCIELNAHMLIACLLHLKEINRPELFMPFLYESQACESTFRQLRSLSTANSTVTNCTVKEAINRISCIHFQNHVMQRTTNNFLYPRMKNSLYPCNITALPTRDEIFKEIEFCKQLAIKSASKLNLIKTTREKTHEFECGVKPYEMRNQCVELNGTESVPIDDSNISSIQFAASDLRNIQLKDYSGKCEPSEVSETGPYIEIICAGEKKIVVKKTSFCWLLGKDSTKLSSDRLLRVRAQLTKQIKNRSLLYPKNQMFLRKRKKIKRKQK